MRTREWVSNKPLKFGDRAISRRRLAGLCGVTPACITMIFTGKRYPSIRMLYRMAEVLNIDVGVVIRAVYEDDPEELKVMNDEVNE